MWIGAEKEDASATRNRYKIRSFRMAAAAIEKLSFKVQHGDELKSVRPTLPPVSLFKESTAELVSVLQVRGVGPGIRNRVSVFLGHEDVRESNLHLQPCAKG